MKYSFLKTTFPHQWKLRFSFMHSYSINDRKKFFSTKHPTNVVENEINSVSEIKQELIVVENDEELQDHWKMLENRIKHRKSKKDGLSGRSVRHNSAWDAEEI